MKKDLVINFILENINSGKWIEGSKIYSEYQFQKALNVSCGTVRSAVKELNSKNILKTVHGSGTYVKTNVKKNNKYILILTNETILNVQKSIFFKIINLIKSYIEEKGYIPLCYSKSAFSIEESFNTIINEICGVITLFPEKKEIDFFKNKKIPVIHAISSFPAPEPSVVVDYEKFYQIVKELIAKYNFKDILFFFYKKDTAKKNIKNDLIFLFIEQCFSGYDKITVKSDNDEKDIVRKVNAIKKIYECIVFIDESIYGNAKYTLKLNPKTYNTKIITQSSFIGEEPEKNVCKLIFDINRLAKENVDLIIKLIEHKHISEYNIFIPPIIENEDSLKRE